MTCHPFSIGDWIEYEIGKRFPDDEALPSGQLRVRVAKLCFDLLDVAADSTGGMNGGSKLPTKRDQEQEFLKQQVHDARLTTGAIADYSLTAWAFTNENHVSRFFATYRQETGRACRRTAYVYNNNRVVAFCHHQHRTARTAKACAQRMLRKFTKGARV